jgi:hypothetical protein
MPAARQTKSTPIIAGRGSLAQSEHSDTADDGGHGLLRGLAIAMPAALALWALTLWLARLLWQ